MCLKRDQTIPYLNGNYPPSIRMHAPDSVVDDNESKPNHFNMAKLKADFLSNEWCAIRINETIICIGNALTSSKCINESYSTFVDFLINEMNIAGLTAGHQSQRSGMTYYRQCGIQLAKRKSCD